MSAVQVRDWTLPASAARYAVTVRRVGPAQIRRRVRVGFVTAARLTDELRGLGIIGDRKRSGYSGVLASPAELDQILAARQDQGNT